MMGHWCVNRSSRAVVIFASPNTLHHPAKEPNSKLLKRRHDSPQVFRKLRHQSRWTSKIVFDGQAHRGQTWKTLFRGEYSKVGRHGGLRQHRDGLARTHHCKQPGHSAARVSHTVGASFGIEQVTRCAMVERVGVRERELKRLLLPGVVMVISHPHQWFAANDGAPAVIVGDRDEREIERVLGEMLHQPRRGRTADLDENLRMPACKAAQDVRQKGGRIVVRAAEVERARQARSRNIGNCRIVMAKNDSRMPEKPFAMQSERHAATGSVEQRLAQQGLGLLHLHAHRRLGASDLIGGAAQRPRVSDRDEGLEQLDRKVSQGIGSTDSWLQNYLVFLTRVHPYAGSF